MFHALSFRDLGDIKVMKRCAIEVSAQCTLIKDRSSGKKVSTWRQCRDHFFTGPLDFVSTLAVSSSALE